VIRVARHRTYPSITRRFPGKRQRVGIVANSQFGSECEQIKSHAREMSHQNAAGNNDEMSGDQCAQRTMLRVVGDRSVPG